MLVIVLECGTTYTRSMQSRYPLLPRDAGNHLHRKDQMPVDYGTTRFGPVRRIDIPGILITWRVNVFEKPEQRLGKCANTTTPVSLRKHHPPLHPLLLPLLHPHLHIDKRHLKHLLYDTSCRASRGSFSGQSCGNALLQSPKLIRGTDSVWRVATVC